MGILQQDSQEQPERVPAGLKTTAQRAKAETLSDPHARRLIQRLVSEGKWGMRRVRILTGRGIYPVPHYGQKADCKKAGSG